MAKTPEFDLRENYGKNYIINGDMRIAQRGTSFAAIANSTYCLDRMIYFKNGAVVHTITQDTDVPTLAEAGYLFQNSLRLNLTTPDTSLTTTEHALIGQNIEGYNWANIAQKPFTVSFWVKATLAGTYTVAATNTANDRSCVKEFTISSTNTWEYKTVTFPASPSSGSWNYTNGVGLRFYIVLGAGPTYQTTPNTWQNGLFFSTSAAVNGVNTGATDFRFTGFQINEGYEALPFRLFGGDFEKELAACQRYYEKSYNLTVNPGTITFQGAWANECAGGNADYDIKFHTKKRVSPTVVVYNPSTGATGSVREYNNLGALGGAAERTFVIFETGQSGFSGEATGATDNTVSLGHFTADAEL